MTQSSIAWEKQHNAMVRFPTKSAFLNAMGFGD
jgi:hypothetical protein